MITDEKRVSARGKIWELHIHSNQCFSADPELKKLSIPDYISKLLEVLDGCEDLDMISFTDHNKICFELYREFYTRNNAIVLLPGIEIDTKLEREGVGKHIIVYFDAIGNLSKLEQLAARINQFMTERHVGSGKGENPIYIHDLLDMLITLDVQFVLSPHSMKQGKRDIDANWHAMETAERKGEMKKYLDQFFCFWESSGTKQIHHATEFLRGMDCDDKMSIIAFSDSKDFNKLKQYLDRPCQYFNALPNFNGLKMAGSELTRITRKQNVIKNEELGSYIGEVDFDGQKIVFTPCLNAIIGGRGSGKSVLLDSIAFYLGLPEGRLTKERIGFIGRFPVSVSSMSGSDIDAGQFHFDYFNQSYIAKLFEKQGADFNTELESYFSTAFESVEQLEVAPIKRANEEAFERLLSVFQSQTPGNLFGFVEKYIVDSKDSLNIAILDKNKKKVDAKLAGFDYVATVNALNKAIRPKIPSFLRDDEAVSDALANLCRAICERAYEEREAYLEGDYFFNVMTDVFKQKKASISKAQKDRADSIKLFEDIFDDKSVGYRKRVALVNSIIGICEDFQIHYEKRGYADGEKNKAFLFKRELDVEHPLDFMIRLFGEQISSVRSVGICNRVNLWPYIQKFCFDENCYKQGFSSDTLYKALSAYELRYTSLLSISFLQEDGSYADISTMSPGTQTNILIEYIVHQDTTNPLLIDQPEDNVDNQTIYNKIKGWFMTLKCSRQVIVVTHDANIVINADADNVILAQQKTSGKFIYDCGALEYGNMLENASLILDGGKEAVKRRLVKYGE